MTKFKMWLFKKLFKNICKIYEEEIEKKDRQIHNLRIRLKFLGEENCRYRIKSKWLQ